MLFKNIEISFTKALKSGRNVKSHEFQLSQKQIKTATQCGNYQPIVDNGKIGLPKVITIKLLT